MITLPAELVPYLHDYAYTTLGGVGARIVEIAEGGRRAGRAGALAEARTRFDATVALIDALGRAEPSPATDVTLDAQSALAMREAVATAKSVEYDRLNEFDSVDRGRKRSRERMEVVKRLSDLRRLEAAIGSESSSHVGNDA